MQKFDKKIHRRIKEYINLNEKSSLIVKTTNPFNIISIDEKYESIINLELINNIKFINRFNKTVYDKLVSNGYYVICSETLEERRKRVINKTMLGFKNIIRVLDFLYKRVLPKFPITKQIYLFANKGHNRVLSKAEILGRLIFSGFEVCEYFEHNNLFYIISKKNELINYKNKPSYGIFFKTSRIGLNSANINVYKIRTMYPYSEYCQDLIYKENKLAKTGKILNDYRINTWGSILRKYWIDELPNILGLFNGNMKIIGVRPISLSYFNKYPKDLKSDRIKTKPACIGIHYCTIPENSNDVFRLERIYLKKYFSNPVKTDLLYFFMFLRNIIFKKIRSS